MSWQGQWLGGWNGDWDGVLGPSDPNALFGTAYISVVPVGQITGVGHLLGVADVSINANGTITNNGGTSDTRLDQILALLTGRKVYDKTSGLWRVYDAGGIELADSGGVLWRGLHGWMLYQNSHLRGGTDYILRARRRGRR